LYEYIINFMFNIKHEITIDPEENTNFKW
jgi:hypothetical protein